VRTCIVHIGTHKTGTTSLQVFMAQNRTTLASAGLYLPDAGRPAQIPIGNHQLAWDLLMRGESKDLPLLTDELRKNTIEGALITSEDFDRLHVRPETIERLAEAIRSAGYVPKVVVYFRPQAGYAESIYVEMIKHGHVHPLANFLEPSISNGMYRQGDSPVVMDFLYTRILEPWVRVFGKEHVIVRAYDPARASEHIFQDFFNVLMQAVPGFGRKPLELAVSQPRANDSLTFGALLDTAFAKLFPHGRPEAEPRGLLRSKLPDFPADLLNARYALFSRDETLKLLAALGPDNAVIEREYGAHIGFQNERDIAPQDDPVWRKATVERAIFDQFLALWTS